MKSSIGYSIPTEDLITYMDVALELLKQRDYGGDLDEFFTGEAFETHEKLIIMDLAQEFRAIRDRALARTFASVRVAVN